MGLITTARSQRQRYLYSDSSQLLDNDVNTQGMWTGECAGRDFARYGAGRIRADDGG